jgi:hypothetical protein
MSSHGPSRARRDNRKLLLRVPRSAPGSLRRSIIDSTLRAAGPEPTGGRRVHQRALLLSRAILEWIVKFVANLGKPDWPLPPLRVGETSVYSLPDDSPFMVGTAADWGSGTADAYAVGDSLRAMRPDVTVHLGDVYFSGTTSEFTAFFLPPDCWPRGRFGSPADGQHARGTYVLNGNHEMYSGGEGYFGSALPTYG